MQLVTGNFYYLFVLCNNTLNIHSMEDLSLLFRFTRTDVVSFCCSDGSPFYGLALCCGKKILLYDLHEGFKYFKVTDRFSVNIPEPTRCIQWVRSHLLIGYKKHYYTIGADLQPKVVFEFFGGNPVMYSLPLEELVVACNKKATFLYPNGNKSRPSLLLDYIPIQFGFFFPFLVSFSSEAFEIRNILDSTYHEVLRHPSVVSSIRSIATDGKGSIVTEGKTVYVLLPNHTNFWVLDSTLYKEVKSNMNDKVKLVRFVSTVVREDNPFHLLFQVEADDFVQKFNNPENVSLVEVKKYIHVILI
eukprot:TRINITY_DN2021_c0_g2_i15.p1 TRINITY_DN2021_c0_g2~~TRINITY_DN2021_c0_g2_i15.p1  ORF type:complete len:302 (+),score=40.47 TRINITY_DN2021_c0_g2_i15:225-1130(+)